MPAENPVQVLTPTTFDAVLAETPALFVMFSAAWCGPCRMVKPVMESLAPSYAGKVVFASVDLDAAQELCSRYQVSSIPTFLFFKAGMVADRAMGAMPKAAMQNFIDRNLPE